ncbi:MAG: protein-L-isoaspartate(D-aspartate) O-methyltransferase [Phycisphaerae bacterium]
MLSSLYNKVVMDYPEGKLLAARHNMVEKQLRRRNIHNESVLAAFAEVPRERFVPSEQIAEAYADHPLPIGHCQTISQPYVVALMVQELHPQSHHRVLDVGAGSGYQTAILAKLVAHVYAVERIEALRERAAGALASLNLTNVTFRTADGTLGLPAEAPFDGIICGAAAPSVPDSWIDQLADGGRIVAPVGGAYVQTLVVVARSGGRIEQRELCDVRFVKLIGRQGWSE